MYTTSLTGFCGEDILLDNKLDVISDDVIKSKMEICNFLSRYDMI